MLRHHGTSRLCWTVRFPPALVFGKCWVSRNGGNCVFWVKCRNWLRTSKANSFGEGNAVQQNLCGGLARESTFICTGTKFP